MIKGMKKGALSHPELTKDLIYTEWVINRLSQKEIAIKYDVGLYLIEARIKQFNLTGARSKIKYILNEEHINTESPIFWYLVGLVISDGYIDEKNKRIVISLTNDYEILETLSDYYSTNIKIPVYKYETNKENKIRYSLTLSDIQLINLFHSIGIYGNKKTFNVIFPDPNSKELFNFLVRGFLDGDGNIRYCKGTMKFEFRFYTESLDLANNFISLFIKYYRTELYKGKVKGRNGYNITSKNLPSNCIIDIYSEFPELSIKRKRKIVKTQVDDIVHRYGMINHSNW